MRLALRAAIAAISIASIGPAFAGEGEGTLANTFFTEIPGVLAQPPVQAPYPSAVAAAPGGQSSGTFVTSSQNGTWLFAPNPNSGANS